MLLLKDLYTVDGKNPALPIIYVCVYIWYPPPPKIHVFTLCSALLTCQHLLTIILSFSHSHFFYYHRGEVHIEILGHIEFQYGGSKIQDPRLHRTLGEVSWIREVHIEILGHIEFQYGGSKIQDPRLYGALGEESWILDPIY